MGAAVATWLDGLAGDLRHAARVFRRRPLLTGLAVLTLSLGIGANAARSAGGDDDDCGIDGNVRPPFQQGDVPQFYVSCRQQSEANMALIVRTAPGRRLPFSQIKQAIRSIEPRQAVFGVSTLEEQLSRATTTQRATAALIGGLRLRPADSLREI